MQVDELSQQPIPAVIVIFGITGDLASRKLMPALYELERNGLLHEKTKILGITRRKYKESTLFKAIREGVRAKNQRVYKKPLKSLAKKFKLYLMNPATPDGYPELKDYLNKMEASAGICLNRLFYLAIPPQISTPVIKNLGLSGLSNGCSIHNSLAHLLVEKPFGFDVATAEDLIKTTRKHFKETQIYRIDHYLAKETVQNLVTFRFMNPIFEDIWDNRHIKSITITANEKLDIEGRANFYEQVGAMRDLIQSHLLHIMAVILMDRPKNINSSTDIHTERLKVLNDIEAIPAGKVAAQSIRGQYASYRQEVANKKSVTETFACIKLFSRSTKWLNVPIILQTGKGLAAKNTSVVLEFKPKPNNHSQVNKLTFSIQPNEGVTLELWVKKPGYDKKLEVAPMQFSYKPIFATSGHPDAYERVLADAIRGDNTLFATSDEIIRSWQIIQNVLTAWNSNGDDLQIYKKGTLGPDLTKLLN